MGSIFKIELVYLNREVWSQSAPAFIFYALSEVAWALNDTNHYDNEYFAQF